MLKNLLYLVLFLSIFCCAPDKDLLALKKEPIQLTSNITIVNDSNEKANFNFGLWMFNKRKIEINLSKT